MSEEPDIVTVPEAATTPMVSILGSSGIHEFIRYFVASGVALFVDAGSLWLMTDVFGIQYLWSGSIAFLLGLTIVYILSVSWVFEKRTMQDWKREFLIFAFIGLVGLGLNDLMLWFLTGYMGLFYMFSKGASIVTVFAWNFGARKWLLFRA